MVWEGRYGDGVGRSVWRWEGRVGIGMVVGWGVMSEWLVGVWYGEERREVFGRGGLGDGGGGCGLVFGYLWGGRVVLW